MSPRSVKTAPYGSWRSPITSDLIVAQSIGLSDVRGWTETTSIGWKAGRRSRGRSVVVRGGELAQPADLTPPPFNVRTRVHEYGGGGVAGAGRNGLFLEFRRRSTLPACSRRIRAAGAHSTAASAGTALAVRRWRDRCPPPALDRRARGSHVER